MIWDNLPLGVPFPIFAHLFPTLADALPPTDEGYRYILLSAGHSCVGGYNEGVLISEGVSGTVPLVVATAVIDLDGSPFDGETVNLINTEGRYLIGGPTSGIVRMDQMQGHRHTALINRKVVASGSSRASFGSSGDTSPNVGDPTNDGTNGAPRIGLDTHGKDISVLYVLRVL